MTTSLKVIICFLTGSLSFLDVSGNKGRPVNTCGNRPLELTAHLGGTVTIHCKYPEAEESSIKHFCKEDKKSDCSDLIEAYTSEVTKKGRYSLALKQLGIYTVTISDVTLEDSGKYRCVVRRSEGSITVCSTEIILQVVDWSDIPSKKVTHKPGDTVIINCQYPVTHNNNTKFLCKGQSPSSCETLIQTTEQQRDVTNNRFKIRDNSRINYFYVYISNLSTADSGTYWCGSHGEWQQTEFTKTLLTVDEKQIKTVRGSLQNHPTPDSQSLGDGHTTHPKDKSLISTGLIGGIVGCLVLSLVLVIILVLIKNEILITQVCCAARESPEESRNTGPNIEANHEEPHYEEILHQQVSSGESERSVYATVNLPANQTLYTSIAFHKDSVATERDAPPGDTIKNDSSTCDYSTVMAHPSHSPEEEQTLSEETQDKNL